VSECCSKLLTAIICVIFCIVTEREIRRGIREDCPTSPENHCLVYVRHIDNMDVNQFRSMRNFIDMFAKNEFDNEAIGLLDSLRNELIPSRLPESNIRRFAVEWKNPDGLDVFGHAEYIRKFCKTFYR
jgi:NACHT domain- and WD repeat-containing protein